MSFNVSRFIVRARQFWTRNRLVPVLGISALFLFGLTSYQYLSSFFGDKPIIARHIIINGNAFQTVDGIKDGEHLFWQFDHEKHQHEWHHEHYQESRRVAWEHARDQKRHVIELQREAVELQREMLEGHRLDFKNRVLEFKIENGAKAVELQREMLEQHGLDIKNRVLEFKIENGAKDDDDKVIIMQGDGEELFEIKINGKTIQIHKDKEI